MGKFKDTVTREKLGMSDADWKQKLRGIPEDEIEGTRIKSGSDFAADLVRYYDTSTRRGDIFNTPKSWAAIRRFMLVEPAGEPWYGELLPERSRTSSRLLAGYAMRWRGGDVGDTSYELSYRVDPATMPGMKPVPVADVYFMLAVHMDDPIGMLRTLGFDRAAALYRAVSRKGKKSAYGLTTGVMFKDAVKAVRSGDAAFARYLHMIDQATSGTWDPVLPVNVDTAIEYADLPEGFMVETLKSEAAPHVEPDEYAAKANGFILWLLSEGTADDPVYFSLHINDFSMTKPRWFQPWIEYMDAVKGMDKDLIHACKIMYYYSDHFVLSSNPEVASYVSSHGEDGMYRWNLLKAPFLRDGGLLPGWKRYVREGNERWDGDTPEEREAMEVIRSLPTTWAEAKVMMRDLGVDTIKDLYKTVKADREE